MSNKRRARPIWIEIAVFVGIALFAGKIGRHVGDALSGVNGISGWYLALLPLTLFFVPVWREFGQLAGGWLSGLQLALFVLGPLRVERAHGILRLRCNRGIGLAGGFSAFVPLPDSPIDPQLIRRDLLRILAVGQVFSLTAGLLLPAFLLHRTNPQLAFLVGLAGILSILYAVAHLVPLASGGYRNDGGRILQLFRAGESAGRYACLTILTAHTHTIRPRHWPRDLVLASTKTGERDFDALSGAWLRACHHLDRGELDDAKTWIAEALAGHDEWPKPAHSSLHATAANIHALAGDPVLARLHFGQINIIGRIPKEQLLHAEALVLFAEGNLDAARETACKALQLTPADAQGPTAARREDLAGILAQMHLPPRLK